MKYLLIVQTGMPKYQKQKSKAKKTQKTKGRKQKKAKKSATGVFFLFFVSSDQEKFCRWQKIRFHGQVAEIAIFTSQSSTRRSNAEIKKTM